MNCSRETVKMGVPRAAQALAPRAGKPSRGTAGLDPRRTKTERRRVQHPRTARSAVAVTPGREFMKYPG